MEENIDSVTQYKSESVELCTSGYDVLYNHT